MIIANGLPNVGSYPYVGNVRYTLQRATGMIAFVFIIGHIVHLHWMGRPLGGGQFDPHAATSSAAVAIHPLLASILYAIGVLCAVFHFANGLWTLGITWGLWTSPAAMRRANAVSVVVGLALAAAGLSSIVSLRGIGGDPAKLEQARQIEHAMHEDREARERILRGEPAARPAAPAVRSDGAGVGVRPVSADSPTGR
jgi:succinate dehydrogenase / fumarate reductase cytochrome b subunit